MNLLGFDKFSKWCTQHGYRLDDWHPSLASSSEIITIEMHHPQGVQLLTEFIDELIGLDEGASNIVVWLRDWTIWNERSANIGLRHLKLLTSLARNNCATEHGNIYELTAAEWQEAIALAAVPILYSWDSHVFFASGRALVNISHHDLVTVALSSTDEESIKRLAQWRGAANDK